MRDDTTSQPGYWLWRGHWARLSLCFWYDVDDLCLEAIQQRVADFRGLQHGWTYSQIWARIVCRLLEWSRDAAPSELLRVIGLCIEATEGRREYDAVDLLDDVGLWAEARFCEDRMPEPFLKVQMHQDQAKGHE